MPALSTTPPKEGTFKHVLQFMSMSPVPGEDHPLVFTAYEETRESICLDVGHGPRHTIFVQSVHTARRAQRDGWTDVTDQWGQKRHDDAPKISTPAQRAVAGVLTDEWQTKAQIIAASGISDSLWRTTIKLLEERGIAQYNLGPRQRVKATTRSYRYKRGPDFSKAVDVVPEPLKAVAGG